ncbi:hypothetical protein [Lysobacter sp. CFH 32150]|uniref:hypothetical protein n=1 Tax=Lysobacter sp. CFH 32150 TaxID=2927128 RepID=UPI001FA744D3|nr:hypothetical protein [Lysobacter sp. CFH 32150]MCI4566380.1 hypothetical protein [Lysobacter sp. CFH 32150]
MQLPWVKKQRFELELLRSLAAAGEMSATDWLKAVPRNRGTYVDFYGAAALFHAGYVHADTMASQGRPAGSLGEKINQTAELLCQIMLKPGESFEIYGCPREPWEAGEVRVFATADGLLRLEEEADKGTDRRMAILVAILAALISALATKQFA